MSKDNQGSCASCDLCSTVNVDPVDMEENGAKLLSARVQVNDVCPGKEVCVACIIYDQSRRIIAFRGFTTRVCKDDEGCNNSCGTIKRKLVFVLPDDIGDPEELDVRCVANYIYPCD